MARVDGQTKQSQTGRRCVGRTEPVIYSCALVVQCYVPGCSCDALHDCHPDSIATSKYRV
jgi:hypothetical protein